MVTQQSELLQSFQIAHSHTSSPVAFPGPGWLSRIADESTVFLYQGIEYSSAYAAIVGDPLALPCRNFNAYVNSLLLGPSSAAWLIRTLGSIDLAHYLMCYLRNFIGAMIVYYGTGGLFHYFCYRSRMSDEIFAKRTRPTPSVMWDQIRLAQLSMILYVLLPCFDEWLIESGYTKVYYTVADIGGWRYYMAYMAAYFTLVEIGIYWMHRTLHTNKWLYKHVHLRHHLYNRPETLTPWASIAFHPLDGILQCSPYVAVLPIVPCHYLTHFGLLFFSAIWATYIHDAMDWNVWEVMGSKYHTVHHTHYIYNYGQVFTFCDRFWGTFREPAGPTGVPTERVRLASKKAR